MTVDEVKILLSDLNRGYNTPYSKRRTGDYRKTLLRGLGKAFERLPSPDRWHDAVLEINSYIKKHGK